MKILDRIREQYGDEYDLSVTKPTGTTQKIDVICPDHGLFSISVDNFLYNAGCPSCRGKHSRGYPLWRKRTKEQREIQRKGRSKKTPAITIKLVVPKRTPGRKKKYCSFYLHEISGGFAKFGITEGSVETRRHHIEQASDFEHRVVFSKEFYDRSICIAIERLFRRIFETKVVPEGSMRDGPSETTHASNIETMIGILSAIPSGIKIKSD